MTPTELKEAVAIAAKWRLLGRATLQQPKHATAQKDSLTFYFKAGTSLYKRAYMRIKRGQSWDDLKALAIK